ncbi:uncharacterized protein BXIN_1977 [Babesia sp. Xinjiang]|uniref:uncharacterized protein n=1 Tax=Babesia sp. Xinjiang TaxID=462227 RepID=UPI000A223C45|nr:uncharacterized protein BXIN_1977 [Babesia sp. Xinjiang]ORM40586.1 hypothetical protein BXIN_1977 [Babesia sp. Xinjiang]
MCIGVGILLLRPFVHINVNRNMPQQLGTWIMKLDGSGNLVTGSDFVVDVSFYNTSIFPVTFSPQKASFYHYPIGSTVECLKFNYIGEGSKEPKSKQVGAKLHKDVLMDTVDGLIQLKSLVITVPPKTSQFGMYTTKAPVEAYFEIAKDNSTLLTQLKPLYLDCKKHKALMLAMRIEGINDTLWFVKTHVPVIYELLLPLNCEVQGEVGKLFEAKQMNHTGLLQDATNFVEKNVS